jgi:transcriptional regulator with XRE-family HTH domain
MKKVSGMTVKAKPKAWTSDEVETVAEATVQALYGQVRRRFLEVCRAEPDFSQQALAERIGVPRAQVSRWLASPSSLTLRAAARLLLGMDRRLRMQIVDQVADDRDVRIKMAVRDSINAIQRFEYPTYHLVKSHENDQALSTAWPAPAAVGARNLATVKCRGQA